jgi:hypothetical protein
MARTFKNQILIGEESFQTKKGTPQDSIISPWIFKICIGPLILVLEKRLSYEKVAEYAVNISILSTANILDKTLTETQILIKETQSGDQLQEDLGHETPDDHVTHPKNLPTKLGHYKMTTQYSYLKNVISNRGLITLHLYLLKLRSDIMTSKFKKLSNSVLVRTCKAPSASITQVNLDCLKLSTIIRGTQ